MRSLPAALTTELAADAHGDLALLVEIGLPTGTIYRTSWNESVTFKGNTYISDAVTWGEISATTAQENPTVELKLQNVADPVTAASRHWSTILGAATSVNGSDVTWRIVKVSLVADETAQIHEENWALNRPVLRDNDVVFRVGPDYSIYQLRTPQPPLKAPRCRYQFKDSDCRSESTRSTCPGKTLAECMQRHPESRLRISQIPFHDARLTRL